MNLTGELSTARICLLDFLANLVVRRELRRTRRMVANHALFIGIGDRAIFELAHGGERGRGWGGSILSKKSSGNRMRLISSENPRLVLVR
ncbi:MAG: hypothetical protein ACR2NX_01400 [Chthoniobacterales bacterium]